jgi:iron(III) transport system ATP-binding protein
MVGMLDYAHTRPHELSGGQQQRVALARALAPKPDVILLDEPFTALDAALRVRLRAEVRELLLGLGTTAILITHDQEEALSTADLVAVMRDGRIVQVGSPLDVYDVPADLGVARFVGDAVELPAVVSTGQAQCALGEISTHPSSTAPDGHAVVVLRPEQLVLSCPVEPSGVPGQGIVRETSYHGHDSLLRVELADGTLIPVRVPGGTPPPRPGEAVVVSVTGPGRVYPA